MPLYDIRIGDGNQGTDPSGTIEAENAGEAVASIVASEIAIQNRPGYEPIPEPDYIDGDDEHASAVWGELGGAPALNGGAAYIIEAHIHED